MKEGTMLLTLAFVKTETEILLAMKKRGFGAGRWNGYGGKVKENETIEEAAVREIQEESEIQVKKIEPKGIINFDLPKEEKMLEVHLFEIVDCEGEPKETEEMKPRWFKFEEIPYSEMWDDDTYWLRYFIEGKKINADFKFDENDKVISHDLKVEE